MLPSPATTSIQVYSILIPSLRAEPLIKEGTQPLILEDTAIHISREGMIGTDTDLTDKQEGSAIKDLRRIINSGRFNDLIRISEAKEQRDIDLIAKKIIYSLPERGAVLIAGPSSSGKPRLLRGL